MDGNDSVCRLRILIPLYIEHLISPIISTDYRGGIACIILNTVNRLVLTVMRKRNPEANLLPFFILRHIYCITDCAFHYLFLRLFRCRFLCSLFRSPLAYRIHSALHFRFALFALLSASGKNAKCKPQKQCFLLDFFHLFLLQATLYENVVTLALYL